MARPRFDSVEPTPDEKAILDRIEKVNNKKGILIGYVDRPENIGYCLQLAREQGRKKVGLLVKGLFEGREQHLTPVYYEWNEGLNTEYFVHLDSLERRQVWGHFVNASLQRTLVQFYPDFPALPRFHSVEEALNLLVECFRENNFIDFCRKNSDRDSDSTLREHIFRLKVLPSLAGNAYTPYPYAPGDFVPVHYVEEIPVPQEDNRQFWSGVGLVASGIVVLAASSILLAVTCGAAVPGLLVSVSLILTMAGVAGGLVGVPLAEARNGNHAVARKAAGAVAAGGGLGYVAAGAFGGPAGLTASNVAQVTSLFGSTAGTTAVGSAAFISTMVGIGAGFFAAFVLIAEGVRRMKMSRVSQSPSTFYGSRRQPLLPSPSDLGNNSRFSSQRFSV